MDTMVNPSIKFSPTLHVKYAVKPIDKSIGPGAASNFSFVISQEPFRDRRTRISWNSQLPRSNRVAKPRKLHIFGLHLLLLEFLLEIRNGKTTIMTSLKKMIIPHWNINLRIETESGIALTQVLFFIMQYPTLFESNWFNKEQKDDMNKLFVAATSERGFFSRCGSSIAKWLLTYDKRKVRCCPWTDGLVNGFYSVLYMKRWRKFYRWVDHGIHQVANGKNLTAAKIIFAANVIGLYELIVFLKQISVYYNHLPDLHGYNPLFILCTIFDAAKLGITDTSGQSIGYNMAPLWGATGKQIYYDIFVGTPIKVTLFAMFMNAIFLIKFGKLIGLGTSANAMRTEDASTLSTYLGDSIHPASMGKEMVNSPYKKRVVTFSYFIFAALLLKMIDIVITMGSPDMGKNVADVMAASIIASLYPLDFVVTNVYAASYLRKINGNVDEGPMNVVKKIKNWVVKNWDVLYPALNLAAVYGMFYAGKFTNTGEIDGKIVQKISTQSPWEITRTSFIYGAELGSDIVCLGLLSYAVLTGVETFYGIKSVFRFLVSGPFWNRVKRKAKHNYATNFFGKKND
jgi:hypothetical protein